MIFVFGDIHGLSDPLKIGIDYIYDAALQGVKISNIIFVGDYIDGGPSSKQVIDQIIRLKKDFPVTALMGNHEDMLLGFYYREFNYLKTGNSWLNNNAGVQTVHSFYPQSVLFKKTKYPGEKEVSDLLQYEHLLVLEPEYEKFFASLTLSHMEKVVCGNNVCELLFSHSIPSPRYDLNRQLACGSRDGLRRYMDETACLIDETLIWNRQLLSNQLRDNLIVIHGHTPTRYYRQMTKLIRFWEEEENTPFIQRDKRNRQPAQIDIDTGLVYGGALTLLAIDDTPGAKEIFPYYISIDLKRSLRHNLFKQKNPDVKLGN